MVMNMRIVKKAYPESWEGLKPSPLEHQLKAGQMGG